MSKGTVFVTKKKHTQMFKSRIKRKKERLKGLEILRTTAWLGGGGIFHADWEWGWGGRKEKHRAGEECTCLLS